MSATLVRLLLFASAGAEKEKRHPRTPFVCPPCLRVLAISPGNAPHVFFIARLQWRFVSISETFASLFAWS